MDVGRLDRARVQVLMERWRIPFRSPAAEITRLLGTTPDIGGGTDVCALPFPAELSAGSGQLAFTPRTAAGPVARVESFLLCYGRDDGARRAFEELAEILASDLGPGKPSDTSNAARLEWRRGPAHVSLVRFDTPTGSGPRTAPALPSRRPRIPTREAEERGPRRSGIRALLSPERCGRCP